MRIPHSPLPFLRDNYMYAGALEIVLHVSYALFCIFNHFSLHTSIWIFSIKQSSSLQILSPAVLNNRIIIAIELISGIVIASDLECSHLFYFIDANYLVKFSTFSSVCPYLSSSP